MTLSVVFFMSKLLRSNVNLPGNKRMEILLRNIPGILKKGGNFLECHLMEQVN